MPICACTEKSRFARAYSSRVASEKRSGLEGVAVRVAGYVTATNWVMYHVCGNGARSRSMAKACSQWRAALSIEAFTASPAGIQVLSASLTPREDIQELLWRDWSRDGEESASCSLYVETRQEESLIIAAGMDVGTVTRLSADVGRALGGVKIIGGKPEQAVTPAHNPLR